MKKLIATIVLVLVLAGSALAGTYEIMEQARGRAHMLVVEYSMKKAALDVMAEAGTIEGHALRVAYAKTILAGAASIQDMAVAVATNISIAGKMASQTNYDDDVDFVVNSMFNAFAGVSQ